MGLGKRWCWFKKMRKESWPWRFSISSWRWKRIQLQLSIFDDILFRILSVFEAIVLVSALCFFYLCCGCHF